MSAHIETKLVIEDSTGDLVTLQPFETDENADVVAQISGSSRVWLTKEDIDAIYKFIEDELPS